MSNLSCPFCNKLLSNYNFLISLGNEHNFKCTNHLHHVYCSFDENNSLIKIEYFVQNYNFQSSIKDSYTRICDISTFPSDYSFKLLFNSNSTLLIPPEQFNQKLPTLLNFK